MSHVSCSEGFTRHAATRVQQRAVPPAIVDWLLEFGDHRPAGSGAESYSFRKKGWRRLQRYLGPAARHFENYRHVYAVVADGRIITVAYIH